MPQSRLSDRTIAVWIGVLYIIGSVAGAASVLVTDPVLGRVPDLGRVAQGRLPMVGGALLVLTMAFALALIPVLFYPLGRRYSETLAAGYLLLRGALETTTYIAGAAGWLVLVALSGDPQGNAALARLIGAGETVLWTQVMAIPFLIGALMFYWLLFRHGLLPRWITVWGLLGAVLYFGAPLGSMLGLSLDVLMAPLAIQEMVLAVWLIVKGFSVPAAAEPRRAVPG